MKGNQIINYIISSEFEARKGTIITGFYPNDLELSLENLMIEKLIPDGVHNLE